MNLKLKSPKLKRFSIEKEGWGTIIFDCLAQPISEYYLIIGEIGEYYYYLSYRDMEEIWGIMPQNEGEIMFGSSKIAELDREKFYLNINQIYCMKKNEMKALVQIQAYLLDSWKADRQKAVLNQLIKNLSMIPRPYSILQIDYDKKTHTILPDLVLCHQKIWELAADKWKNKNPKEYKRIKAKLEFHSQNLINSNHTSKAYRIRCDLKELIDYLKNKLRNVVKKSRWDFY